MQRENQAVLKEELRTKSLFEAQRGASVTFAGPSEGADSLVRQFGSNQVSQRKAGKFFSTRS